MSLNESIVEDAPSNGSGSWAMPSGTGRSSRPVNKPMAPSPGLSHGERRQSARPSGG